MYYHNIVIIVCAYIEEYQSTIFPINFIQNRYNKQILPQDKHTSFQGTNILRSFYSVEKIQGYLHIYRGENFLG